MREWVSLNSRLMPAEEARVSVFDSGLMQGIGLFETMRAYEGRVFRLERHLERLANSARTLGWTVLPDPSALRDDVQQVLTASGRGDLRVRLTVTTGSLRAASDEGPPRLTVVAMASPEARYPDHFFLKGVTAMVSPYRQNRFDPTCGHKTVSYFARLASLRAAHARQAFEALWFTHEDFLAEGAISSIFLVKDGELLTPPLDTPVLPGVTRAAVLELAAQQRIPTLETPLTREDLAEADEVFLTNSMIEVVPVVRIERDAVGTEKIGEITRRIGLAYSELVQRECGDE